jgi:CHAD domain-containing protein
MELAAGAALGGAAAAGKALLARRTGRREQRERAFRLRRDETVPDGIRRVARGQADVALDNLRDDSDRGTAVHEARKATKRLRTLLRLSVRDHDEARYRRENETFRDIARGLAVARDSQVMVETLDELGDRSGAEMPAERVGKLRLALAAEHDEEQRRLDADDAIVGSAIEGLEDARTRIAAWTLSHEDFRALAPGLKRIYRRGRRAYKAARDEPSTENLHELRKRVKDLWYATQVLRCAAPSRLKKLSSHAHDVSNLLGEEHDLAVLRTTTIRHRGELADPAALTALTALLDRRRAGLQEEALDGARALYSSKPSKFVASIERRWAKRMPAHV